MPRRRAATVPRGSDPGARVAPIARGSACGPHRHVRSTGRGRSPRPSACSGRSRASRTFPSRGGQVHPDSGGRAPDAARMPAGPVDPHGRPHPLPPVVGLRPSPAGHARFRPPGPGAGGARERAPFRRSGVRLPTDSLPPRLARSVLRPAPGIPRAPLAPTSRDDPLSRTGEPMPAGSAPSGSARPAPHGSGNAGAKGNRGTRGSALPHGIGTAPDGFPTGSGVLPHGRGILPQPSTACPWGLPSARERHAPSRGSAPPREALSHGRRSGDFPPISATTPSYGSGGSGSVRTIPHGVPLPYGRGPMRIRPPVAAGARFLSRGNG